MVAAFGGYLFRSPIFVLEEFLRFVFFFPLRVRGFRYHGMFFYLLDLGISAFWAFLGPLLYLFVIMRRSEGRRSGLEHGCASVDMLTDSRPNTPAAVVPPQAAVVLCLTRGAWRSRGLLLILRGAIVNRTYDIHKKLPGTYLTIFTDNIWS